MSKKNLELESGLVYTIVGLPASGKSTFLKQSGIPEDMILSPDNFRSVFAGTSYKFKDGSVVVDPVSAADNQVWEMVYTALEARMKEGLTTFLDAATFVKAGEREHVQNLADGYGVKVKSLVLPFDVDKSIHYDSLRKSRVGKDVIKRFHNVFLDQGGEEQLYSEPHYKVDVETKIDLVPNQLPHENYDIVGDVHGLYDDFVELIEDMGYAKDSNGVYRHAKGRNLLLLGDFVDRGTQNMEMLEFVYKQSKNTDDKFIIGNHENKLLNFVHFKEKKKKIIQVSPSAGLTAAEFLKLDTKTQQKYHRMLLEMPKYYIHKNVAFGHANIENFDPLRTPSSYLMYSDEHKISAKMRDRNSKDLNDNQDYAYSKLFESGINQYYYVRGHIPLQHQEQKHVTSLDDHQAFDGHLVTVSLNDLMSSIDYGYGVNNESIINRVKTQSRFNFKDYEKEHLGLYKKIKRLKKAGLAQFDQDADGLLQIFKYKKDVFFKRKWEQEHDLLSCRGIVFDFAGRLVQYPFDKVFNYNEPNEKGHRTGVELDKTKTYQVVEKLNGFLGNITRHPYKNDLLFSTTGSLTSPFVGYIQDMVKSDGVYGDLMKWTSKNPNVSLMFEVIHPNDPHIVKYDKSEQGVYLIGAREKVYNSKMFSESELDAIAEEVGLRRPSWEEKTLKKALDDMKSVQHEGYMIRDLDSGDIALKLKSSYYLSVKFVGRLSGNKTKFMFANPKQFKKNVDEEFYDLIDTITGNMTQEHFESMDTDKRTDYVRELVDASYKEKEDKNKKSKSSMKIK